MDKPMTMANDYHSTGIKQTKIFERILKEQNSKANETA